MVASLTSETVPRAAKDLKVSNVAHWIYGLIELSKLMDLRK